MRLQPAHLSPHRLPAGAEHARLKALSDTEPAGLLQVSADVDADYTEGSELTYLHGVGVSGTRCLTISTRSGFPPARGRAFHTEGEYPAVLQEAWAARDRLIFSSSSSSFRARSMPSDYWGMTKSPSGTSTCVWIPRDPD